MMEQELTALKTMLHRVGDKLRHNDELMAITGEKFNVFSILKMESAENKTHSAFLGELLNPKGSHGFGTLFLKLFLTQIGAIGKPDEKDKIDVETAKLSLEQPIGGKDDQNISGGRVDIYLRDNNDRTICIENKIYAADQYMQVTRYVKHNKGENTVYYLTLNGDDAHPKSRGSLKEGNDYYLLSYGDNILNWLINCQKEAVQLSTVSSGIGQYITLIRKLTNQLSNQKMAEEIQEIIRKNYQAAITVRGQIENTEKAAAYKLFQEAVEQIKNNVGSNWNFDLSTFYKEWGGLVIMQSANKLEIDISVVGYPFVWKHYTIIGIGCSLKDVSKKTDLDTILGKLELFDKGKTSDNFYVYQKFLSFEIQSEREKLFNQESRKGILDDMVKKITSLLKEIDLKLPKQA